MGENLVIVESPAKAKTIQKYLGKDFRVAASMGHVRDLPKSGLAIDIEHDFTPDYEVTKQKVVSELRQAIKKADAVYLATDPDREGEAIAWHITQAIGIPRNKPVHRVVFQEITRNAVRDAISRPRQINAHLVDAQQARRVLDRLVGYQLSPLLWDKVKRGLSAGRVQSVAVRLLVEREQEIEAFTPVEYWTIEADLLKQQGEQEHAQSGKFRAVLIERNGKKLDKFEIQNTEQAQEIVQDLEDAQYVVHKVTRKDKRRNPAPPFTTSTLQQEAGRKLGFSAKKTMTLAQRLYEGIDVGGDEGTVGLITYMRTDSTSISQEAQQEARQLIASRYGDEYLPDKPPTYKSRAKGAQEAHEAIRPTSSSRLPERLEARLERDMFRLYDLIWKRFIASQMSAAIFDSTTVDIAALKGGASNGTIPYLFRTTGSVLKFKGFLAVYIESRDEGEEEEDSERRLPPLSEQEALTLLELLSLQHFTEPPPRYTEASLVKELEKLGIGRPSTYAPIISTIQDRGYVELGGKKLIPTTLGRVVTELLVESFPDIIDYEFTSGLEQRLDDIATGEKRWVPVLREFYTPFEHTLAQARQTMRNVKSEEIIADIVCPKCNGEGELAIKFGRHGEFLGCSRQSRERRGELCDFTSDFHRDEHGNIVLEAASSPETSDVMCHVCGKPMVLKKGRFGPFYGCSDYPNCTTTRRIGKDGKPVPLPEPTGVTCPKCQEGELLKRRGRFGRPFYSCGRYPECDYAVNDLAQVSEYDPEKEAAREAEAAKNGSKKTTGKASSNGTSNKAATTTRSTASKKGKAKKTSGSSTSKKTGGTSKAATKNDTGESSASETTGTNKTGRTSGSKKRTSSKVNQEADES
jgi:DNA topoisomerase-1